MMLGTPSINREATLLEVSTLGRFEVHRHPGQGQAQPLHWSRRKVSDLFKVLLSAEQHRLHREQIQELLWPTSTSEQAANSFGKTLYLLRRALEPELTAGKGSSSTYVLLDHDTLALIPAHLQIDADIFEFLAKQLRVKMRSYATQEHSEEENSSFLDEFDGALALYSGDYLPEDLYEDWAQRRRDRLRRVHSWLLESAADLALASGQAQRTCEYLQALLERNSVDEQTHRQLMLVYARMGRRSDALNQYLSLRQSLRDELHARPLPETEELFRNIQSGKIAADLSEGRRPTAVLTNPAERTSGAVSGSSGPLPDLDRAQESSPHSEVARKESSDRVQPLSTASSNAGVVGQDVQQTTNLLDPDRILKAELVGRQEQLARMQHAYRQSRHGQRRAIFISGEPGIGKTRLARDFTRWGEESEQATVLWGYCYEMSGMLPYQPIADAIGAHARTCSAEQLRNILGNSVVDLAKIIPEIRFKLAELPQPESQGPEAERRNLYSAVARYFNALAAERPLIVILDDLQWADTATIQLLNFLLSQGAGTSPFDSINTGKPGGAVPLYLMLYRGGEVDEVHPLRSLIATLSRGGVGEELRLQRLSEEQVHQLLVNMAGHSVNPLFASEIYRQTEGNPFFVGEAVRSLVFEGKVKWTGERWQATVELDQLELPHSVRMLIERRLLQLSPDCRTTLTLAAVLGRQFSSALLCQARNLSEDDVAEHIDHAIATQILSPLPDTSGKGEPSLNRQELDLAFTHDKIREVLYQWLNPLRRRTLHRQVAQAIEARYLSRLSLYYCTLAYHYQMAEDAERAVDYLLKAAQQAISVYAYVDAADHMSDALELLIGEEERPRRAALLRQLSDIYLYTGRTDKAIEAGLASSALWRDLGEVLKEADARLYVAFCYHWQGRESESVQHIKQALATLEAAPDEIALRAKAYAEWGLAATMMGDVPLAGKTLQCADELYAQLEESARDPFIPVVSLSARIWWAFLAESPQEMLDYSLRAAEVCRSSHRFAWEPMMTYGAAWAQMLLGKLREGEQTANYTVEKALRHNAVGAQGWANLTYALLAIQAGRWEEAEQAADKADEVALKLHNADLQARVQWSRSMCAGWQDDWERAIAEIEKALPLAQLHGETSMFFPHLLAQTAKAHFFAGKAEEGQHYLDQAMQLAESRHYRQLPAICQRLQGRIWQAQGKFEQAQPCFERSLSELLALGDVVEHARTEEAYGLFYLERGQAGDAERGQALTESARATFKRLGVNG
jgi:predicted ATPase/DNA-binding SARP family transcriptional activator